MKIEIMQAVELE